MVRHKHKPTPDDVCLPPFRSTKSLGLLNVAELTPELLDLRTRAQKCVTRRDVDEFLNVAAQAARTLERLQLDHRLYFNQHFMFIREPSPVASVFDEIMAKTFHKACDHSTAYSRLSDPHAAACEHTLENTSSGYAISGLRGVGKSHLLRLCTVLAPVLLPNVVSAYVDAEAHMLCSSESSVPDVTPFQMLRQAFMARVPHEPWLSRVSDVNGLVCRAAQRGYVTMLSVDELRCVYKSERVWMQLHQMATNSATALFVADSSSRLPALIRSDMDSQSTALTQRWYGVTRPSLNDTKLALTVLEPLTAV